jgi:hypothetical protein
MKLPFEPTWRAFAVAISVAVIVGFVFETTATRGWPGMFTTSDLMIGKGPDFPVDRFACLSRNWKYPCAGPEFARQQIGLLILFVFFNPIAWVMGCLAFLLVAWFEAKKK